MLVVESPCRKFNFGNVVLFNSFFLYLLNSKILTMNKRKIIENAISLLRLAGFDQTDYVISLQGPTVIFSQNGIDKLRGDADLRVDLINCGISIME